VHGVPVNISMRHDTNVNLMSTATERATYTKPEGAFYGDLFAPTPVIFACGNRTWSPFSGNDLRFCALSQNGTETDCELTYTGRCTTTTACTDRTAPFGSCRGLGAIYSEVITIYLTSSQQAGNP
jgi:hypothetical protein